MCGIVGFLNWHGRSEVEQTDAVASMTQELGHRGPDDSGTWVDARYGMALGHRRLSIVDLSRHGHQPMRSACGRFRIVYNGEVYNHALLRKELESLGHRFRGHSDTEVLVQSLAEWGIRDTVRRLIGMFAFAVWDQQRSRMTLVRDRIGIKPVYYGWANGCLLFGSELKAIRVHPEFRADIDRGAVARLLRHGYIPAPHSIYRGIQKLPAGTMLVVSRETASGDADPMPWWEMDEAVGEGLTTPFRGSADEAVSELDRLLRDSVAGRMEADVPLGAFLSGGIDSSTVVALMQAQSTQPVRTFSIGFKEFGYDEAPFAKAVANHLGTEHTECYVTSADARNVIPRLPELYDEPFADPSQIPTFLVSRMARNHVTVCLSGDGGDELFCGYDRYRYMSRLWRRIGWCPPMIRRVASRLASAIAGPLGSGTVARKLRTLAELTSPTTPGELYGRFNTHWRQVDSVVLGLDTDESSLPLLDHEPGSRSFLEHMMHMDSVTYLPDDILVKLDRASMAVGLEARVPVLDHRVVEFAWRVPLEIKTRGRETKWLLRRVLERYVPRELIDRPKMGFGVPIDVWLRGPLREWAEELLSHERLRRQGFFDPEPIRSKWQEHLSGRHDWQYLLWDVLMFQAWLERYHG
ncbi:MAG: asparagine synthase (glutamine-hydrolyzing) [Planctomycetes bacterium]|nr:asparagine synthase (glutamine-hydrolyzing) [Planctomycetota bacterium]MBL7041373.1 asparagine synthase (glutamine-hydrolyzing) [Pirellulaceae bacterium]